MLGNLKRYHDVLRELAAIPEEEFRSDKHKIARPSTIRGGDRMLH